MQGRRKRRKKGIRYRRWILMVVVIVGLIFLSVKYKLHIKRVLKKQPAIYHVVQKGKSYLLDNLIARIKSKRKKSKPPHVEITVDADNVLEKYEKFWGGFGHDYFYSGVTLPKNRAFFRLIEEVNRERQAFTFYRAHNMFSDRDAPNGEKSGGRVYREDANGNPIYNWDRVDEVFDIILGSGMKPIVELSFMPEALTSDPARLGDWRVANVAPPKDYVKWKNLVRETVIHLQERYSKDEVESWYFEVWNEPDLWYHFWIPDKEDKNKTDLKEYLKLYDYSVAGAMEANPNIKIGGPAIAGWPYVLEGLLEHTKDGKNYATGEKGSKIDFYSFHKYGDIEDNLIKYTRLYVGNALLIDKKKFSQTPFLIDEFGPVGTRWRPSWKNTPYVAAWICKAVDGMFDLGFKKGKAYRPSAMVFWGSIGENFRGDAGVLATVFGNNAKTILKGPVFNAYDLLSYLGDERLALDGAKFGDYVHGLATRHGNKSIEVMLYHLDERYKKIGSGKDTVVVDLKIENLDHVKYFIRAFKIDEAHANAFALWRNMGRPAHLTSQQIKLLKNAAELQPIAPVTQVSVRDGVFRQVVNLEANSVSLTVLTRVTDETPPLPARKLRAIETAPHAISLQWEPPLPARDGETAASYLVYRDGKQLANITETMYRDENLTDGSRYTYTIYSVDKQGNICPQAIKGTFSTNRDDVAPEIVSFVMNTPTTIMIYFNKPIDKQLAADKSNYAINNGVEVRSVFIDNAGRRLLLSTSPHIKGREYVLRLKNIRDRAKMPNSLVSPQWRYKFALMFADFFEKDTGDQYRWSFPNNDGSIARHEYDAKNQRLNVITGDNLKQMFSHPLPYAYEGVFKISFLPYRKYPAGGAIELKLKADEQNYYLIKNTDGYGPGKVEKYVDGKVVESEDFKRQYSQNKLYNIEIKFGSDLTIVNAFGQTIKLKRNAQKIQVRKFEFLLAQQDAFIDNISYQAY